MAKRPRRLTPVEQYDRFMVGGKTPATFRGLVHLTGGILGNTLVWVLGLITVARLGMLLAFVLIAAIVFGVLRRVAPALEWQAAALVGAAVGVLLVAAGVFLVSRILARDARRLGQTPTFGVDGEDARLGSKQRYRRKAGR
jgi:hypothetical protein